MPNKMFNRFFNRETFSHKVHHSTVLANLAMGALFAIICILPACSIDTNDKGKDGEKQVDIKSPIGDLHVSEQADIRDAGLTLYRKSFRAGILHESNCRGISLQ
jgi:hypothetical protein